jgi:predicted MFS family arabinose efflux permease
LSRLLERAGYASALRIRDLRLLLGGLAISATGSWAYNVALLAYVFEATGSLGWVGAAGLARFVPALLFSAYGGVVAERFERVRLMVSIDLLCALWQALLAVTIVLDGPVGVALALAALTAATNVPYNPAVAAMLPDVAGEEDLAAANALNGTIENLVVITGPAIGAGLLVLGSPALAVSVDAASFVVSALIVARIRIRSRPSDVTEGGAAGPLAQMLAGARAIASSPSVRLLVGFCVLVSFVYGTDTVLLVGVSEEKLGTGPDGFGYLLAGLGLGGVLMAAAVNRLAESRRLATIILAGAAFYCLPTALLTVIHSPAIAFLLEVVRGGGTLVVDVIAITALQRSVAPAMVARVFGVFFAFVLAAISLGTIVTPVVVHGLGLDAALFVMAVVPAALAVLGFPALTRMDRANQPRMLELEPRIAALEALQIFAAASRPVLERLGAAASVVTAPPGNAIVAEGEPSDALYVLTSGSVEVRSRGESGGPAQVIRTMRPGSYFGEIGLLGRIPRTATVTALEPCELLRIPGDEFLDALTAGPPSGALIEGARARLTRTHPSREALLETIGQG